MRKARIIGSGNSVYHCMSRVVDRRFILGDEEKSCFLGILRKLEAFSGVRVLTYCLMDNHFHVLLQVPEAEELDAEEILDRIRLLNGAARGREERQLVQRMREQGASEEAVLRYLSRFTGRMHDLSLFMQELKQRFSRWYNRRNKRKGTLWEERYKSVLVESTREALMTIAHYIDLNPVRAGICEDPKDYRWCGYGAAVGGGKRAGRGIRRLYGILGYSEQRISRLLDRYRVALAYEGVREVDARGGVTRKGFDREAVRKIIEAGGRLDRRDLLRCRVRYFSDGVVLGSKAFVDGFFQDRMEFFGPKRKDAGRKMRGGDWTGLCTVRDFRQDVLRL